jgi:hypothetical protein
MLGATGIEKYLVAFWSPNITKRLAPQPLDSPTRGEPNFRTGFFERASFAYVGRPLDMKELETKNILYPFHLTDSFEVRNGHPRRRAGGDLNRGVPKPTSPEFDRFIIRRKTERVETLVDRFHASLDSRRLPGGGWPFNRGSVGMALEPTCLALMALGRARLADAQVLLNAQRPDGSWGSFANDDEASGLTGLALLTLNTLRTFPDAAARAADWLIHSKGREASWPWQWKFRTRDTQVVFAPEKFGWPWQSGTCSWVVPTALALLALKQSFSGCHNGKVNGRIQLGVEMLQDRACPRGGWNAGNGVVYGSPMTPHIDATAIALLALRSEPNNRLIRRSLRWLEDQASICPAAWSLAWSILALNAYDRPVALLQQGLVKVAEPIEASDTATLALAALALECTAYGNPFKVIA